MDNTGEALNVQHAFYISAWVFGILIVGCTVAVVIYICVQERRYQGRDLKHCKTEDNIPVVPVEDCPPELPFDVGHIPSSGEITGKHRALVPVSKHMPEKDDPTVTTPDLGSIVREIQANGKHHAAPVGNSVVHRMADTVPDMGIPREVLEYNVPVTRLDLYKAEPHDTDYFDKIKDMVDGIR